METEHGRILRHWQPKGPATRTAYLTHRATPRLYRGPLQIGGTSLDAAVVPTEAGYTYTIGQTLMPFAGKRRRGTSDQTLGYRLSYQFDGALNELPGGISSR